MLFCVWVYRMDGGAIVYARGKGTRGIYNHSRRREGYIIRGGEIGE